MSNVLFYIGIVLFLISCISYGVYFSYIYKNKLRTTEILYLKKHLPILGSLVLTFTLSLVFFTIAFYTNETTLAYISNKSLVLDAGHQFLSYFFVILLGLGIGTFVTSFLSYFYLDNFEIKFRNILKKVMFISIPLSIIFLIAMGEGNAPYLQYPLCNALYIGKHGIAFINSYTHPEPYYAKGTSGFMELDGGILVAFYAIFILSGACLVFALCDHLIYKNYGKHGLVTTCFFIAFPSGVIGARIWYVLLDISQKGANSIYVTDPIHIIMLNEGGLGIMGGAILGIIAGVAVMLYIKYVKKNPDYKNVSYLHLVDIIIPTILIAQAIGRFGNFFNAEVHGNEIPLSSLSFLPSFIKYNYQYDNSSFIGDASQAYLPLATIETITNLIGYFFIYYGICVSLHQYHANGSALGWYLIWYGTTRALLEPLRYNSYQYDMSIWSSYAMIICGIIIVLFFIGWKIIREKKLLWYKDKPYIDSTLKTDVVELSIIKRNVIILSSITCLIVVLIIIFFFIW